MRNRSDALASIFFMLVGIGAVIGAISLTLGTVHEPQPGFFPFLGGVTLIVLASILLLKAWRGRSEGTAAFGELGRPILLVVAMIFYVALLDSLGYPITTFILSILVLRILGVKAAWVLLVTGLILSVGTYILFDRLLDVILPLGILEFFR